MSAISLTLLSHSAGILIMVMTKQTTTNKGVFKRNGSWTIRGVSYEMDVSSLFYFSQKRIGCAIVRLECDRSCVRDLVGSNQR